MALIGVTAVLAAIGLFLPAGVQVQRSLEIDAPPERVFPFVNDLRAFNSWSPWAQIDPATRHEFSDPSSGRGAWMRWSSDDSGVGSGTMRIEESIPNESVAMILDFGPQGTGTAGFTLVPAGGGTQITWSFETDFGYDLIGRYFGLMLDGLIGAQYEQGLASLKALVEKG